MRRKLIILVFTTILIFGCKNNSTNQSKNASEATSAKGSTSTDYKKVLNAPDFDFIITTEEKENTIVHIKTDGLTKEYKECFPITGQIKESHMADLNNDKLQEFYIVIAKDDNRGTLQLVGFTQNSNNEISMVPIDNLNEKKDINTEKIEFNDNTLLRSYKSNGVTKTYNYNIVQEGSGFVLKPTEL